MKIVYIAHPLGQGPDRDDNIRNATRWCAYLAETRGIAPVASWILLASCWDESKRDLGIAIDLVLVRACHELWLVGGRVSAGMALEAQAARDIGLPVFDLTHLGWACPA